MLPHNTTEWTTPTRKYSGHVFEWHDHETKYLSHIIKCTLIQDTMGLTYTKMKGIMKTKASNI